MKLFLIYRTDNVDWDEYESAVVCAKDEADARSIHPNGRVMNWNINAWCREDKLAVAYLGKTDKSIVRGFVLASYNAG